MKAASVTYEIVDNTIKYYAYCDTPDKYYKLQGYIDWIDQEINHFCDIQRSWDGKYRLSVNDVDRTGVNYDETKFRPVRGKQFTLQQNKIIRLLMGVGLYKDPYASLRELGAKLNPPLSRSGVNHRLQRIMDFAEKLAK